MIFVFLNIKIKYPKAWKKVKRWLYNISESNLNSLIKGYLTL